jgi:hypothetical protein
VIVELAPSFLTWDDVDPARHFFDSASAPQVVRSLGPALRVPSRPGIPFGDPAMQAWSWGEGQPWADAMSHALAEHGQQRHVPQGRPRRHAGGPHGEGAEVRHDRRSLITRRAEVDASARSPAPRQAPGRR